MDHLRGYTRERTKVSASPGPLPAVLLDPRKATIFLCARALTIGGKDDQNQATDDQDSEQEHLSPRPTRGRPKKSSGSARLGLDKAKGAFTRGEPAKRSLACIFFYEPPAQAQAELLKSFQRNGFEFIDPHLDESRLPAAERAAIVAQEFRSAVSSVRSDC